MPTKCDCCGTSTGVQPTPLLMGGHICRGCIAIWYDEGLTKPEDIGQRRKERQALLAEMAKTDAIRGLSDLIKDER